MNRKIWALVALMFALSACHLKVNKESESESDKATMSYELSENGCKTGKREFKGSRDSANAQLCSALQNDGLNCFCASDSRKKHFELVGCGGKFNGTSGQMNADCDSINDGGAPREALPTDGSQCPDSLASELTWLDNLEGFNYFSVRYRCPRIQERGPFRCTVNGKLWTNSDAADLCIRYMN